jgi:putative transposase
MQDVLCTLQDAGKRCFQTVGGKPRLKAMRNELTSIRFPDPIKAPKGNRVPLPGLRSLRFHKQELAEGKIKRGRLVKRTSGWYFCLFLDAEPKVIEHLAFGEIGIDPGFSNLLTPSDGETIEHPRELEASAERLAQAQRGHDKQLAARIRERIANREQDRNHKLTTKLVAESVLIVWSKDKIKGIAKRFGKSVSSSAHPQIRGMLSYKSPQSGTTFIAGASKFSTKTCNECGSQSGPTELAGLSVRPWTCPCGAEHDRDINAACNTLIAAVGTTVEVAYA